MKLGICLQRTDRLGIRTVMFEFLKGPGYIKGNIGRKNYPIADYMWIRLRIWVSARVFFVGCEGSGWC
jgi:hypothetical protein